MGLGTGLRVPPRNGLRMVARHASTDAGGQQPRPRPGTAGLRQSRRGDPALRGHDRSLTRELRLVRDFRDGADGMLHSAHAGSAAQLWSSRPLPHASTDPAGLDARSHPQLALSHAVHARSSATGTNADKDLAAGARRPGKRRSTFCLVDLYTFSSKWRIRHFSAKKMGIPPLEMRTYNRRG